MLAALSPNEEAQLQQTIEMFEVIAQSQPQDYQSLEILKEAYYKLGRQKEVVDTSKRIARAYMELGQLTPATLEYESVLRQYPDDPDVRKALTEIEKRASSFGASTPAPDIDFVEKAQKEPARPGAERRATEPAEVDDGRKTMHKLFVEGNIVPEKDFNELWVAPDFNNGPAKIVEPFLQLIADKGYCALDKSIKLLCEKTRLGYMPLEQYDVDFELARSFPRETCLRWCVLPFDRMSKSVLAATVNPFNKQATRDLENSSRNRVLWYVTSPVELVKALRKTFR